MSLKEVNVNEKIIEKLLMSVKYGSISHAYIFEGDANINKFKLALNYVQAILCEEKNGDCCETCPSCKKIIHGNHEDLIILSSEGNTIKDEMIEDLQYRIKKKPYYSDRNLVIIKDADKMTMRAQNRLLKTLEEPSIGTVIILLSENIENLTQTILSRCVIYKLNSYHSNNYQNIIETAIKVAEMLLDKKTFYEISSKLTEFITDKEIAVHFLDALESWYRDLAVAEYYEEGDIIINLDNLVEIQKKSKVYKKIEIYRAIKYIEEAKNDINRNLNISYSVKSMILKITA